MIRRFPGMVLAAGILAGSALIGLTARGEEAKPFLHPLFSDNMVFQRDIEAPVWGWTTPGAKVTVTMGGKSAVAGAGPDGKWLAKIGPFHDVGPYTLQVSGPATATVTNVLAGDVWICSGQSNMQWSVAGSDNAEEEIAAAGYPRIRLFTVPNVTALEPKELVNGSWSVCGPETVRNFTAVGYFFGRTLHLEAGVPIGLINTSWGGTIAEAWTSHEALLTMPDFVDPVKQVQATAEAMRSGSYDFDRVMDEWWAKNDPGSRGEGWQTPAASTADWKTMALPGNWEEREPGAFDGIIWFRLEFTAPQAWAGKEAVLHLGPIDDRDTTWLNGTRLGGLDNWMAPRDYKVPAGVVKTGRNVIAVRVLDTGGGGGLYGKAEDMRIEVPGAGNPVPLAGDWKYRIGAPLADLGNPPARNDSNPNVCGVLYNAMIAPLIPFGVKGAIWYQGESNAGRGEQYARLLPTLITDWRTRFGVGDFPFLIVHLANFMDVDTEPRDDPWPRLREAQWITTQRVPNAELALAIDIGDAKDIHPRNKQDVGRRLALAALGTTYGRDIEYSGPVYREMAVKGKSVRLRFDHIRGGLQARDAEVVKGFAVAGADKRFYWAQGRIDGDSVVVQAPEVDAPVAVRYAWSNNPVCNLYNGAGLPAVPFRTDDW